MAAPVGSGGLATTGPAVAAGNAARPVEWAVIAAVLLTSILEILDRTIVNVALPHIRAALGLATEQTSWILTSYIVASVVTMPLTGYFARRIGRRRLILTAISTFAAFSMLAGVAGSLEMMVFARLGQGLFGAFLIPLAQSILFDSFPRERRGEAMALFGMGVVVAPVLGPTLGAVLTEYFSWRAVFYVNVPVAAFALLLMAEQRDREEREDVHTDWTGLALMVAAIGALQLTLDLGNQNDWFHSRIVLLSAIIAFVAGAAFIWRGRRVERNIVDLTLFRDRSFAAANVAILGFGLATFGAMAILPLFVQQLLGFPVLDAGYLFIPRGLAAAAVMILTGPVLMQRLDPRLLIACGLGMLGLGNLAMAQLDLDAGFWEVALPGLLSGAGMGLFFVPMSTVAFQNLSGHRQDEAAGLYSVARAIGSSIGVAVASWQFAERTQIHWNSLAGHVNPFNPSVASRLAPLGLDPPDAEAWAVLAIELARQAQLLAFQDIFFLTGMASLAMMPIVLVMERPARRPAAVPTH